jgi:ankyrin repeat domain-containing protein 50
VQCQLDSLEHCVDSLQIDETLESLPKDLPATYERILIKLDPRSAARVRQVLVSLAFARRPLRVAEILDMMTVSTAESPYIRADGRVFLSTLLAACGSLVVMSNGIGSGKNELRLAHASVKDYLVSDAIRTGPARDFGFFNESGNRALAEKCLGCLLHHDKTETFGPPTLEQHPFTVYAALNWHFHAQDANDADKGGHLDDMIFSLFHEKDEAYANWHRITGGRGPDEPVEGYAWDRHFVDGKPGSLQECLRRHYISQPLFHATEWNFWRVVTRLLDAGHDPNVFQSGNSAPMHGGAERRALKAMEVLHKRGARIDIGDWIQSTPLLRCIYYTQDAATIEWLLAHGANPSRGDHREGTVLQCAAMKQRPDLLRLVLEKGKVDPNQTYVYRHREVMTLATALQCAAYVGSIPCMEVLVKHGAAVRQQATIGTALDAAAAGAQMGAVVWLLANGADIHASGDFFYRNVLMAAGHGRSRECVELLLEKGAIPDSTHFKTAVPGRQWQDLDADGRTMLIDDIIETSVYTCCRDITEAATRGLTERIAHFLETAKDRRATMETRPFISNRTPFNLAAMNGHIDTVIYLAGQGAYKEAQSRLLENPLESACLAGNLEMVKCLLSVGCTARFRIPGKHRTAWISAQMSGNDELVRFLKELDEPDGAKAFEFRGKTYIFDGHERYKVR